MTFQYELGDCVLSDDEIGFLTERGLKVMYHKDIVIIQNQRGGDLTGRQRIALSEVCPSCNPVRR